MKKNLLVFLFLISKSMYPQGYFDGKELHCQTENKEAKRLFDGGIKILHLNYNLTPKYLEVNAEIFGRAILQDTTFCDAYFFAGYILNLEHQYPESFAFYKGADRLSPKPILIYKQNLAAISMKVGLFKDARKSYQEIVNYFPESPEGYYGFALTSPMFGDIDKGLENVNIAIEKYKSSFIEPNADIIFLKGVLLAKNKKYEEGLEYLYKSYSSFKEDENFKIQYSLCLLKVSELKNNEKMKQKALEFYNKIENKKGIAKEIKDLLIF